MTSNQLGCFTLDLCEYEKELNKLLTDNGSSEKFILEKDSFEGKEFDILVLRHKTDSQKKIEFVDENGGGILYYLSLHDHIDYVDDFKENVAQVFERVKQIIDNKIVTFLEVGKNGKPVIGGSLLLELDVNAFEYGEQEKEYLKKTNISYELWSEVVTESMKLFVIGSVYTMMPAIEKQWSELCDIK